MRRLRRRDLQGAAQAGNRAVRRDPVGTGRVPGTPGRAREGRMTMCFDATRPEAGPLMEAAAAHGLPERLRLLADAAQAAATEIDFLRAAVVSQAREIEQLKAGARGRPAP